jgi:hypothetical protein
VEKAQWFKLKSWHAYRYTSRGSRYIARCGKWTNGGDPLSNVLPLDERSCESCLRLLKHDAERP